MSEKAEIPTEKGKFCLKIKKQMKLKNNQQLAKIISVNDNLVRRWVEDVEFRKRNPNVSAETSHWDIEATSGLEDKERVKMNADTVSDDLSIIGFEPMQTKGHSRTNLVRIASVKDKKLQKEIINKTRGKSADEIGK